MSNDRFRRLSDTTILKGRVWDVVDAEFVTPDGERFRRDIVRSPGAVGVVPIVAGPNGTPHVVLVAQYRPPYEREVVEIPAGLRDVPGEAVEVTGKRELVEEAGLDAGRIELLTEILPSPGMTDSVTTILLATQCTSVEQNLQGPEEQHLRVFDVSLDEAVAMVEGGEITDAKSVVGILLADRRRAALS